MSLALAQDAADPAPAPTEPAPDAPPEPEVPADPSVEAPPPRVYELAPTGSLPSAVRAFQERADAGAFDAEGDGTIDDLLDGELDLSRPALIRGAWFVRPRLAFQQLVRDGEDGSAMRLGLSAGRRWWTAEALPVQLAADVGIRATAPVGEGNGRRVEAFAHLGPWLGPVRVELGLNARWERERWLAGSLELPDALLVGPELGVGVDAEHVQLAVGVLPAFQVAGDRPPAKDGEPVLPAIGHETTWWVTVGLPVAPVGFVFDAAWRDTAIGGSLEIGLSLRIRIKGKE